jgi:class 3 adenylate cyclase
MKREMLLRLGLWLFGVILLLIPAGGIVAALRQSEQMDEASRRREGQEQNASVLSYFRHQESFQGVLDKKLAGSVREIALKCRFDERLQVDAALLATAARQIADVLRREHIPLEHLIVCQPRASGDREVEDKFPVPDFPDQPVAATVLRDLLGQLLHHTTHSVSLARQAEISRALLQDIGSFNDFAFIHNEFQGRTFPVNIDGKPRLLFWTTLLHPDYVNLVEREMTMATGASAPTLLEVSMYPKHLLTRYLIGGVMMILAPEVPPERQIEILLSSFRESSSHLALRNIDTGEFRFSPETPDELCRQLREGRDPARVAERAAKDSGEWVIAEEMIEFNGPWKLTVLTPMRPMAPDRVRRHAGMKIALALFVGWGGVLLWGSIFRQTGVALTLSRQIRVSIVLSALLPLAVAASTMMQLIDDRHLFKLQQNRLNLLQEMESVENRYHFHRPRIWHALDRVTNDPRMLATIRGAQREVAQGNPVPEAFKTRLRQILSRLQAFPYRFSLRRLIVAGIRGFFHSAAPAGRDDTTDLFRVMISLLADNSLMNTNPALFREESGALPPESVYGRDELLKEYGWKYLKSIFGPEAFLNLLCGFGRPFSMGAGHGQWFVNNYLLPEPGEKEFFVSWMYLAKQTDRDALARILARPTGDFRIYSFEADRIGNFAIPQEGERMPVLRSIARQVLASKNRVSLRLEIDGAPVQIEGSPLTRSDQFVLVGLGPEAPIHAETARWRGLLLIPVAGMLLVVLVLAWVASWDITAPLTRLREGLEHIDQGRFAHRLPLERSDELGEVTLAFNEMARGLEEAEVMKKMVSVSARRALDNEADEAKAQVGEALDVTVVFIGIPGFPRYLREMEPERLTEQLDQHTTRICRLIHERGGEIDKLIGDKTLAYFSHPDLGASGAVTAALSLVRELFREQREGTSAFPVAIGINTGMVIKGLLGSGDIRDYTIIGDPVNVAARAESVAEKLSENRAVITANTLSVVPGAVAVKPLNITQVKGKQKEVLLSQLFLENSS